MPQVQKFNSITKHIFPSEAAYVKAMELGKVNEGDEVYVEGEEYVIDEKATANSQNLITSGAVHEAVTEAANPLSNTEIEQILSNFT